MRLMLLFSFLCLYSVPVAAQSDSPDAFRATTEVRDGEFVLEGRGYHRSSMAPLVIQDLPAGRYWLTIYRDRKELSKIRLDSGRHLSLEERRGSRAALSTVVPGLGQYRDLNFFSALVPFLEVGFGLTQTVRFASEVGNKKDYRDRLLALPPSDPQLEDEWKLAVARSKDDLWLAERARNQYGILTAYFHVGNILHAASRRGPLRFRLTGTNSVSVDYDPPSRPWVGVLSALYPGLGQTRMGRETRGLVWSGAAFVVGVGLVEAQRELDYREVQVGDLTRRAQLERQSGGISTGTLLRLSESESDRDSAKGRRNGVLVGLGALWLLNIADAVFLSDLPPVPLEDGRIAGVQLHLEPAWVGEAPGLALSGSF